MFTLCHVLCSKLGCNGEQDKPVFCIPGTTVILVSREIVRQGSAVWCAEWKCLYMVLRNIQQGHRLNPRDQLEQDLGRK